MYCVYLGASLLFRAAAFVYWFAFRKHAVGALADWRHCQNGVCLLLQRAASASASLDYALNVYLHGQSGVLHLWEPGAVLLAECDFC